MIKMDLKTIIIAVCVLSAAKSLIGQMSGGLKIKGQLKLILDIIFALVITTPFISGFNDIQLPELSNYEVDDYEVAQRIFNEALAEKTASNVCDILTEQITSQGLKCDKITVDVNILNDGCISINRVTVRTSDIENVEEVIRNTLGVETEVVNEVIG